MTTASLAPAQVYRKPGWRPGELFLLLAPTLQFLNFRSVGLLYATDLLLLGVFPVVLARGLKRLDLKYVRLFLFIAALWLVFQVTTDIVRGSAAADYLRGWSKISLTITHFTAAWLLIRSNLRRFTIYGIGVFIGRILSTILVPTEFQKEDPWKYGYGVPFTILGVMLCTWLARKFNNSLPIFTGMSGLAFFNFQMGYRSLGGICFVALAYWYLRIRLHSLRQRFRDALSGFGSFGLHFAP